MEMARVFPPGYRKGDTFFRGVAASIGVAIGFLSNNKRMSACFLPLYPLMPCSLHSAMSSFFVFLELSMFCLSMC